MNQNPTGWWDEEETGNVYQSLLLKIHQIWREIKKKKEILVYFDVLFDSYWLNCGFNLLISVSIIYGILDLKRDDTSFQSSKN